MTARRNVAFGLMMQGRPKTEIETMVDEALALVRLSAQGDKLPGQMSGGQQQRVAIARAIVVQPPLVLMDEPLSNLDAKLRLEMRAEIRRIHNLLGSTTIYVTHDQDEALSLADRIVVLRDGAVRQVGTPEELYARPAHADVAEFMGYRNLLPSRAKANGDGHVSISFGGATLAGTPIESVGSGQATVAIRPDDLTPRPDAPICAVVETAEYRGRDFYGTARTPDNVELFFRSDRKLASGETVRLGADPARVLVYAGGST
jgi:putative spermidine/putrescine transport system ATP-binding protein